MRFYSDNTATVCPELLNAIQEANEGFAQAYGDDPWTRRLDEVFSGFFDTPVRAFPVATGTAANALALATLAPPYGAIFAHEFSHVLRDECGAPSFFSGGAQLVPVPGADGKLTAQGLGVALDANPPSVHSSQPAVVSLTQATEAGTVYRPSEIAALSELAHSRGLKVHMDGARFANALVFLNCQPADITARAGVDVLSFGATKNGALAAEAVVFFDRELARDFELRRKRAGHLFSKCRYVSAQLLAYVETGVWKRNAQRANSLAQTLGKSARSALMYPVESNQVFLRLDPKRKQALRDRGFGFFDWGAKDSDEVRLVVSWDQSEQDVHALVAALESICV
ncbi:MAG TPA: beta-eliminating lyase-related protein [Steroidobacteraceae bacterium]